MPRGSCLCGDVGWDSGELTILHHCHCSLCRKAHGAPFASWAYAAAEEFRWLNGEDGIGEFESSPGFVRPFCRRCGSSLPAHDTEGQRVVPLGCLDEEPGCEAVAHVYAASCPAWSGIRDEVAQFDELPPGMEGAEVPQRERQAPVPGALRGSCLCGGVAWLVTGEPIIARFCHCSRCRKARSAAYTANLVVPSKGFRFTAGEERTTDFHVPDARFFHCSFCQTCGGSTPRVDPDRGIAIVPMGALDDEPGIEVAEHIWVRSKASWHEITDDLPQHEAGPPG